MRGVRRSSTAPELSVCRLLKSMGTSFSILGKGLPGTPDIVNRRQRWAIFVHGCFWHAHDGCAKSTIPKTNIRFWKRKFLANKARDARKERELCHRGFDVLCIWECETNRLVDLQRTITQFLAKQRTPPRETFILDRTSISRRISIGSGISTRLPLPTRLLSGDGRDVFEQALLQSKNVPPTPTGAPFTTVDLFSGCGGFSLGAAEACRAAGRQFVSLLAADMNTASLAVFKDNFSPLSTFDKDIVLLLDGELGAAPTKVEQTLAASLSTPDLLLAGPPCQGYSDLNNHTRRRDSRNNLYNRVARFVEVVKPRHVVIENVPGVVHGKEYAVSKTKAHLESLGYHVTQDIVDLTSLGVPQRRRRHVLVASKVIKLNIPQVIRRYHCQKDRTVKWAIGDLANTKGTDIFQAAAKLSPKNIERINYLRKHSLIDLPNKMRPKCHQNDKHSYKSMYGRLSYLEPAQTITSGFGSPGQGRYIHPSRLRTLTPHEAARIQYFPDYFDFSSVRKRAELCQMIGNAVPMKLSYVLTLELIAADANDRKIMTLPETSDSIKNRLPQLA